MKETRISEKAVELILTCKTEELQHLTETGIASIIGVDNQSLSQDFKIDQYISISDFILREKIYRAYFLLRKNSGISIDELSRKLGFSTVEDFNTEFEKHFAINPQKFRDIKIRFPY